MVQKERVAFVLVDGIGDVSIPKLGYKTPLQVAQTPFLDAIAAAGYNGLMDPVEPGLACGSDTAHMSLFGYDPRLFYRGRGAYESMGAGLDMKPGDIAFKCNFATINTTTGIVTSRRADRRFDEEGPLLCAALDSLTIPGYPEYAVRVKYATEHRCGVVVSGPGLTDAITGTDPLKDNLRLLLAQPSDTTPEAIHTAAVVNALSDSIREILEGHMVNKKREKQGKNVANVVLLRGCGCRLDLEPFHERHGMKACIVAPTKIIAGLGMCTSMDVLEVEGTTGDYRTLFHKKAEAIAEALAGDYEFGFLHVKAVDDAGHDHHINLKLGYQQVVDTMIGQLIRLLYTTEQQQQPSTNITNNGSNNTNDTNNDSGIIRYTIVVTGDHSTPVEYGDHSIEPVPLCIAHVRHVVDGLGGMEAVEKIRLGPIPHPYHHVEVDNSSTNGIGNGTNGDVFTTSNGGGDGDTDVYSALQPLIHRSNSPTTVVITNGTTTTSGDAEQPIKTLEQEKQLQVHTTNKKTLVRGDAVCEYSEIAAASGALGRFPGSEMMPLIRRFAGIV